MQAFDKYRFPLTSLIIGENLLILNGCYLLLLLFFPEINIHDFHYRLLLLFINIGTLVAFILFKIVIDRRQLYLYAITKRACYRVGIIMLVCIACLFITKTSQEISRLFILCYFPSVLLLLIIVHWMTREIMSWVITAERYHTHAVILGAGVLAQKLYMELANNSYFGIHVLGFFDDNPEQNEGVILGNIVQVKEYVLSHNVSKIYCTLPLAAKEKIMDILQFSEQHVINFYVVPTMRHYVDTKVIMETIGGMPVLSIRKIPLSHSHNAFLKRFFDLLLSGIFLITLFPLIYIVVGIAIKAGSPGPVFFKQKRTGKRGKDFTCYKFRSMQVNQEADNKQATRNDERVTHLGDFLRRMNIDELPQFINVLKGEMSIVGPRPHMLAHTLQYSGMVNKYMVRHFIKPGITGLAQISGFRGETKEVLQMEKRVKEDIYYIENWSLFLDLEIVLLTIGSIFKGDEQAY